MTGAEPPPTPQAPLPRAGRWGDLGLRVLSGLVLAGLGALTVELGGLVFEAMTALIFALMAWELAALTDTPPDRRMRLAIGTAAGLSVLVAQLGGLSLLGLALAPVLIGITPRRDAGLLAAYGFLMLLSAAGFAELERHGAVIVVWLVLIVVVSDIMGYFAGRLIGGPKFWPAISPKKTWSGTVAGWIGSALLGAAFALWQGGGWSLVVISPLVALAGQMGDIVESLIKRRAGVKDASRLIPGHGGVLDRFDALIGAILAVRLLQLFFDLPLGIPG